MELDGFAVHLIKAVRVSKRHSDSTVFAALLVVTELSPGWSHWGHVGGGGGVGRDERLVGDGLVGIFEEGNVVVISWGGVGDGDGRGEG